MIIAKLGYGFKQEKQRAIVKTIQKLLQKHGYSLKVDGLFGYQTQTAVAHFQKKHNLKATGVVDDLTWKLLNSDYHLGDRILKLKTPYMRGKDVEELQELLNKLRFNLRVDGIFGPETLKRVKEFQKYAQIKVDGIVGPQTIKELKKRAKNLKEALNTEKPKKPIIYLRKRGVVVLDVQHKGKKSAPSDLGASFQGLIEALEVQKIFEALKEKLIENGYSVVLLTEDVGQSMDYGERHRYVNQKYNYSIYLAGHLNAGGGNYGLFGYGNKSYASIFADTFEEYLPFDYRIYEVNEKVRGYACIDGVYSKAVLCEPLFIDNFEHRKYLKEYFERLVEAYYQAILKTIKRNSQ